MADSDEVVKLWVIREEPEKREPDPRRDRSTTTLSGRTNLPRFLPVSKYRTPFTEPSFLPIAESSSIPIQIPVANSVGPINAILPLWFVCLSLTDSPLVIHSGKLAKLVFPC